MQAGLGSWIRTGKVIDVHEWGEQNRRGSRSSRETTGRECIKYSGLVRLVLCLTLRVFVSYVRFLFVAMVYALCADLHYTCYLGG